MKLFSRKKTGICFLLTFSLIASFAPVNDNVAFAATLEELQQKRNELANDTKEAMAAIQDLKDKQLSVQEEIDVMDQAMASVQAELDTAQADLDYITAQLEESQEQLDEAIAKREEQFDILGQRLQFLQEQGSVGYLDILLDSQDFSDLLLRMQYVNDIMEYDKDLLEQLQETQDTIQQKTDDIAQQQAASQEVVDLQQEKLDSMDAMVREKEALLKSYENDEEKYQQLIEANNEAARKIQQTIAQLSGSSTTSYYTGNGTLGWPVPSRAASSSSLSSGFVQRTNPVTGKWESHSGYDIPAAYGADIVAAEAGTVIYSGWMSGYGYTIMIDHGGGITTLYGHNSSLVVSKGTQVSRGQVVAKCGSTGISTGNHCHFSVLVNGTYVNPQSYLGVANVSY